jgi:hypothetical protein
VNPFIFTFVESPLLALPAHNENSSIERENVVKNRSPKCMEKMEM